MGKLGWVYRLKDSMKEGEGIYRSGGSLMPLRAEHIGDRGRTLHPLSLGRKQG